LSEKTRHKGHTHEGAQDPSHPHPGTRMPKVPDKATLGFATLFAGFIAFCVLLLFVLPAEYGIDPTRIGQLTGISKLYSSGNEIKLGGAGSVHRAEASAPRNDTFTITLDGLGDNEFKLHMVANQSIVYTWTSTGPVNYDFHGEPDEPSRPGEFASYDKGQATEGAGSFTAPFEGRQGWYFQNVGGEPVTITLQTWGYYDVVGLLN
jgi:hypothetical protein